MKYQSITGKEWILSNYSENLALEISQKFGIDNFLSKLLSIRKISPENCQSYLNPKIKEFMPNPSVLKDMDLAVDALIKAIKENKRICIIGDIGHHAAIFRCWKTIGRINQPYMLTNLLCRNILDWRPFKKILGRTRKLHGLRGKHDCAGSSDPFECLTT